MFGRFTSEAEAPLLPADHKAAPPACVPRLDLASLRPASSLSQDSLLPQRTQAASPTCSSFGTLSRASTVLSNYPPSPQHAGQPGPVCKGPPGSYDNRQPGRPAAAASGGGSLLADILNLKRSLEGSPATGARAGWHQGPPVAKGSSSRSLHSLDASLQRLAALTGGLALRK